MTFGPGNEQELIEKLTRITLGKLKNFMGERKSWPWV